MSAGNYERLAAVVSWVEFFREPPGVIASRFTLGQLALIAWQIRKNVQAACKASDAEDEDLDLRQLSSEELGRHAHRLGT